MTNSSWMGADCPDSPPTALPSPPFSAGLGARVTQALGPGEIGHISAYCQEKGQELSAVVTALQASPGPPQKPS